jgi:hypothetical protein
MEASFEKLLALLAKGGVRFILAGGVAVAIQGYVRLTEDVDLGRRCRGKSRPHAEYSDQPWQVFAGELSAAPLPL